MVDFVNFGFENFIFGPFGGKVDTWKARIRYIWGGDELGGSHGLRSRGLLLIIGEMVKNATELNYR